MPSNLLQKKFSTISEILKSLGLIFLVNNVLLKLAWANLHVRHK
jgi:hypothetical protein